MSLPRQAASPNEIASEQGCEGSDRGAMLNVGPVRQVILQATSFCNIDCSYCYIPGELRAQKRHMSAAVVKAALRLVFDSGLTQDDLELRWHDGEPLARGIAFYKTVFDWTRSTQPQSLRVWHTLQTNGMLINDAWIELFLEYGVAVGISLDGSQSLHDSRRRDRQGRGTHTSVMQGVERLRRHSLPFDVICVLGEEAFEKPDELYDYFDGIGVRRLGLNFDDYGWKGPDPAALEKRLRDFLSRLYQKWRAGSLRIREFEEIEARVLHARAGTRSMTAEPLAIINVRADGSLSTFSPELLTLPGDPGKAFVFGNVQMPRLMDMLDFPTFRRVSGRVRAGVEQCRMNCEYFDLCGGGSPANKLFETGDLAGGETMFCRWQVQHVANLIIDDLLAQRGQSAHPVLRTLKPSV